MWRNVAGAQLCANALYGFTGAQTSMLQCLPLADSCLAMGAASTRRAVETIHKLAADGAQESEVLKSVVMAQHNWCHAQQPAGTCDC